MFDSFKRFWLVLGVVLCAGQSVFGFSLLGPFNEAWQVNTIGFNEAGDVGAPKNFGQGYRLNTPTNYYAYDESFLQYFGSNGIVAVDAAFAMFNNLPNVSQMDLNTFPFVSSRVNPRASALALVDLKSYAMSLIIEQMGVGEPDRYTWVLHDRFPIPGAPCPNFDYLITQRNFDPATLNYSSFVNNVLYGYQIEEFCGLNPNPFAPLVADAFEIPVDPLQVADSFTSVAASVGSIYNILPPGAFFQGFTRDDIGALKYLYNSTNAYNEQASADSLQIVTNQTVESLTTSNLAIFQAQALTNDAATLIALYPGLVITGTTNFFTNIVTTNVTGFLTNPPFAPAGNFTLVLVTNLVTNTIPTFFHTFGNIVIFQQSTKSVIVQQTTSIQPVPFGIPGTFRTITTPTTIIQTLTNGDFFILPTNLCGPFQILGVAQTNTVAITNFIPINTNLLTTNLNTTVVISQSTVTFFTNHVLLVHEVDCATNTVGVHRGIEHVTFVRRDFDSLVGTFWEPVTNNYHLTAITNGANVVQTFRRAVTAPDFLITAQDLAGGPAQIPVDSYAKRTAPNFNVSQVPATPPGFGQAEGGPGTIQPFGRNLTFNSVGPIFENDSAPLNFPGLGAIFFQTNALFLFQFGSFDGTTNAPIVYPSGASLVGLEQELLFQITSDILPTASVSSATQFNVQLQTQGASAAIIWSLAPGSAGLPHGLSLSPDGIISGFPTQQGTFDFTVQAAVSNGDPNAPVATKPLFINVGP